jgi:hypothetical protein
MLQRFSQGFLAAGLNGRAFAPGGRMLPIERTYQDAFTLAVQDAIGCCDSTCAERLIAGDGAPGRVDFYVEQKGWAVEMLRDSDRLHRHLDRFGPGGKYTNHRGLQDYLVLNSVYNPRKTPVFQPGRQKLWHILLSANFQTMSVIDGEGCNVAQKFVLEA